MVGCACRSYTVYVPLTGGMAALPGHARPQAVLDKGTLFWAIRYIANLAKLKHSYMIKEISAFQTQMHAEGARLLAAADAADGQEADGRRPRPPQRTRGRRPCRTIRQAHVQVQR